MGTGLCGVKSIPFTFALDFSNPCADNTSVNGVRSVNTEEEPQDRSRGSPCLTAADSIDTVGDLTAPQEWVDFVAWRNKNPEKIATGLRTGLSRRPTREEAYWEWKRKYDLEWTRELRDEIRKRDGCVCQLCSKPQTECARKLDVHHVNYNKKNSEPLNLISLCRSCHITVNAHRANWTKYFSEFLLTGA